MRTFSRLFALFAVVSLAELALLVWIGGQVGFWPTVGLVIVTALVGSSMARREGLAVVARLQRRLREGGLPSRELTDGLIILMAGVLLITPGVLSDVAGVLGLLPPSRAWIRRRLEGRFRRWIESGRGRVVTQAPFSASPFSASPFPAPSPASPATAPPEADPAIEDARILSED